MANNHGLVLPSTMKLRAGLRAALGLLAVLAALTAFYQVAAQDAVSITVTESFSFSDAPTVAPPIVLPTLPAIDLTVNDIFTFSDVPSAGPPLALPSLPPVALTVMESFVFSDTPKAVRGAIVAISALGLPGLVALAVAFAVLLLLAPRLLARQRGKAGA